MAQTFGLNIPANSTPAFQPRRVSPVNSGVLSNLIQMMRQQRQDDQQDKVFTLNTIKSSMDWMKDMKFLSHRGEAIRAIENEYKVNKGLDEVKTSNDALKFAQNVVGFMSDSRIRTFADEYQHYNKNLLPLINNYDSLKKAAEVMGPEKFNSFMGQMDILKQPKYDDKFNPDGTFLDLNIGDYVDMEKLKQRMEEDIKIDNEKKQAETRLLAAKVRNAEAETELDALKLDAEKARMKSLQQMEDDINNDYTLDPDARAIMKNYIIGLRRGKPIDDNETIITTAWGKYQQARANGQNTSFSDILGQVRKEFNTNYYDVNRQSNVTGIPGGSNSGGSNGSQSSGGGNTAPAPAVPGGYIQPQKIQRTKTDASGNQKSIYYDIDKPEDVLMLLEDPNLERPISIGGRSYNMKDISADYFPNNVITFGKNDNKTGERVQYAYKFNIKPDDPIINKLMSDQAIYKDDKGIFHYYLDDSPITYSPDGRLEIYSVIDVEKALNIDRNQIQGGIYRSDKLLQDWQTKRGGQGSIKPYPSAPGVSGEVPANTITPKDDKAYKYFKTQYESLFSSGQRPSTTKSVNYNYPSNFLDYRQARSEVIKDNKTIGKRANTGEYIVFHQTEGNQNTKADVLDTGDHKELLTNKNKGAHVLITRTGRNVVYADPNVDAGHGYGYNDKAVGIEFQGTTRTNKLTLTDKQIIDALQYLFSIGKTDLKPEKFLAHSDFDGGPPEISKIEKERIILAYNAAIKGMDIRNAVISANIKIIQAYGARNINVLDYVPDGEERLIGISLK